MQAFVRAKNANARKDESRTANDDIHDLKVPVPALDLQDPAYSSATQPLAPSSNASSGKRSTKKAVPAFSSQAKQDGDQYKYNLTPEDAASFDDIDDFDTGFKALPAEEIERLKQKKLAEINGPRLTDKYIDGDSYPDTTSGRLTDVDPTEFQANATQGLQVVEPQMSDFRMAPPPKRTKSQQKSTQNETTRLKDGAGRVGVQPEQSPRKGGKPQQTKASFQKHDPYAVTQLSEPFFKRPDLPPSDDPRLVPTTPKHNRIKKRSASDKEGKKHTEQHHRSHISHQPYAALEEATIHADDVDAMTAVYWPLSNGNTRASNSNNVQEVPDQQPDATTLLDYDETELRKLQYEQLKAEDFDKDPRAQEQDPSQVQLDLKSNLSMEEWAMHFESLDLEKWEDAGDWFVTQFSDILSRMKSIRRAKRAIAQQFEQEIEDRHNVIVKKRIVISETMQGMRTHGAQVLDKHESDAKETT